MDFIRTTLKAPIRMAIEGWLKFCVWTRPRARLDPDSIESILIFAYHGLGNFIMYTPALKRLRERYPDARIDLQVGNNTGCEEVLAGSGLFDNIYNTPHRAGVRVWVKRLLEIRRARYDVTVNEFHSHSALLATIAVLSRAPFRVGHVTSPGWAHHNSRFSFIFNIPVRMAEDEHEIDRYMDLAASLDAARIPLAESRPFIHLTDADRRFAQDYLAQAGISPADAVIGIQPGTSPTMRWKQWPIDRYRVVIERIVSQIPGVRIVLFGNPLEVAMCADLMRGLESRITLAAGQTSVKQVAALIEGCRSLICNDSGLMHIAVAVGTPVVAIYGPTDIRRTRPWGAANTIIRHELPCSPCFKLEGEAQLRACPHHDCLMTITPEEVFERAVAALREDQATVGTSLPASNGGS
jgi:lipopolysaccharide heptosyltransferase II